MRKQRGCAGRLGLSTQYFKDMLRFETGKTGTNTSWA